MIETLRLSDEIAELMGTVSDERAIRSVAQSEAAQRLNLGEHQLSEIWPELKTLRDHCRAQRNNQTHFVDVTSVRPSTSMAPPSGPPQSSRRPQPVCGVCSRPGPNSTCSACDDRVCSEHLHAPDGWCERCVNDFSTTRGALGIGLPLTLGITAAFASLLLGAVFGAVENGVPQTLRVLLAPVLALGLSALFLGAGFANSKSFALTSVSSVASSVPLVPSLRLMACPWGNPPPPALKGVPTPELEPL